MVHLDTPSLRAIGLAGDCDGEDATFGAHDGEPAVLFVEVVFSASRGIYGVPVLVLLGGTRCLHRVACIDVFVLVLVFVYLDSGLVTVIFNNNFFFFVFIYCCCCFFFLGLKLEQLLDDDCTLLVCLDTVYLGSDMSIREPMSKNRSTILTLAKS